MKFINYLEKISGVDIYGLMSLLIFVLFFTIMLVKVARTDKATLKQMGEIPLDNDTIK